ncbi:MAG TPA: ABC transporter ATP-binding protein [Noviherbaspirillum sp.]|jgi:iron complex transport system ATP-binding protein|uniref:ABC transporter ATP-binding protein n=1 Tax=Noviherbaspirillum sp. TaxID=1926288 RepID=UPI002DDD80A9|nr:ABC transporter ATP-binding protein [Noviherbaspirillum sp.]HEV2609130.1 ABC transporter ATP-binding protein [Noviherbaspirillum sp.]
MSAPVLQVTGLRVQAGRKTLCDRLQLRVAPGEFWCVLGRNGAGKSTLLHTLAGLIDPVAGRIDIHGENIQGLSVETLAHYRGLLAQQQVDAFSSKVLDTVVAGRYPYQLGLGWDQEEDRTIALRSLAAVGLADAAGKDIMKLSGGERQRVALATLLAQDPDILLLDEPTAQQDAASQLAVMGLMRELSQSGTKAVVAACHDINLVSRYATHVLILANGRHWSGLASETLTADILGQAFDCRFELADTAAGRLFIPLAS